MEEGATSAVSPVVIVEDLFKDYKGRQAGILKALTTSDVLDFVNKCNPKNDLLCLFSFPDGSWKVDLPCSEVPTRFREPTLGINLVRDDMSLEVWLQKIARHSDAWLISHTYFDCPLDKNEKGWLFDMINELPTVFDVVSNLYGKWKEKPREESSEKNRGQSTGSEKPLGGNVQKEEITPLEEEILLCFEQHPCGGCLRNWSNIGEFWIGREYCQKWFHGSCVNVTPVAANNIDRKKCPSCTNERTKGAV